MILTGHTFYNYRQRAGSIMKSSKAAARIHSLFEICNRLIGFIDSRYMKEEGDREIRSWLYVKVCILYNTAFQLLLKIKTSEFILPVHHLYRMHQIYDKLEKEPLDRCLSRIRFARRNLKKYLTHCLSPWFHAGKKAESHQTLILIYNSMWNEPFPILPEEVPDDCIITTDRHYFSQADAVVFHMPTLHNEFEDDLDKRDGQLWIAWSLECEENYPFLKDTEFMSLFDLRMSYHACADIIYPYYTYDYLTKIFHPDDPLRKINRTCMLISSDINQSKRKEYLQELMQYTETDSFGKIFNTRELTDDRGRSSKMELYSKYKFVIAFENSISLDYVTEKFFDPLLSGSVPVYFGAPNIEDYAPGKNSYVDVRQFDSPRHLAGFINACYRNEELYLKFFNWKKQALLPPFEKKVREQKDSPFFSLCVRVKEKKLEAGICEAEAKSMGKICLCTFADSRYAQSLSRLKSQAEDMNLFSEIFVCDERDLDDSFKSDFQKYLNTSTRGYGYWVWKPHIILEQLKKISDGDVLLYADAGCHINYRGKRRFIEYWKTVKTNGSGFLISELEEDKKEGIWTKGDVLDCFKVRNNREITDTPQYQASVIFIRKNKNTVNIVRQWLSAYYSDFRLVDDSPSISCNMKDFAGHRHDQSILSILLKINGTSLFSSNETYTADRWEFLEKESPILIKRDLK
jgi:hypothetical protein